MEQMVTPIKEVAICAIVGMIGKTPEDRYTETYLLMRELMIAAQVRGTDASGIVYKTAPYERPSQGRVVISTYPGHNALHVMPCGP